MRRQGLPARAALSLALAALFALSVGVGAASAKSTVINFSSTPTATQAGAHPTVATTLDLSTHSNDLTPPPCLCDDPKDVHVHVPAGVVANPHVVSICSTVDFAVGTCPADSQVGFVAFRPLVWVAVPLYRVVPQAGQAALFGFILPGGATIAVYVAVNARTGGDYGLDFDFEGIARAASPFPVTTVFWGVPGDAAHDPLRFSPGEHGLLCQSNPLGAMLGDTMPPDCTLSGSVATKQPVSSSLPVKPFTQNPTTCAGPLMSTVDVLAYDGEWSHGESPWPATTGCDQLSFNPSLAAAPTTTETDSASGLAVDLKAPQFEDPNTPSPSELRGNTVTLPPGFSINPSAADGKTSCSDAQANFGNREAARCPEFSKVGTTVLDSSTLPGPIPGYIYLGEPKPGDPYRIILTASGFGTNVKIAGSVHADPVTGQLVTVFQNLPQSPFQDFNLHFFGSERGLLATPTQCGTYPVKAVFESGPAGKSCPNGARPFEPSFQAGAQDNTGGAHSTFTLQLGREDGEQNLSGLTVKTPPGFLATLAGIPYCPEAAIAQLQSPGYLGRTEQAAPACPAASKVGSVIAGAGAGTHPVYVGGSAYLAGPYKGAPLSLLASVPAISGPYDLGTVAVRVALHVDPETAQVTAISDPLPQILEGIPLRTRFIRVSLDRPNFALNPTNCDPFSVQAQVSGSEGATSTQSALFQVANCADLPYAPKLRLKLSGGLNRLGHPAIHARFTQHPGEAGTHLVSVALPKDELLDNEHLNAVCTRVQFAQGACPPASLIGTAKATSPLLDQPLTGSVYLRTNPAHELPDLVVALKGQIEIELAGRIDTARNGGLRTTFDSIPDAPVSSFSLDLAGGKKGLLQNERSLCGKPKTAAARMVAQNGRSLSSPVKLEVRCSKAARRKARRQRTATRRRGAGR
jgi:hypothetical protein